MRLEIVRSILRITEGIDHVRLLKQVHGTLSNNEEAEEGEDTFAVDHQVSFVTCLRAHSRFCRQNKGKALVDVLTKPEGQKKCVGMIVKPVVDQVSSQLDPETCCHRSQCQRLS